MKQSSRWERSSMFPQNVRHGVPTRSSIATPGHTPREVNTGMHTACSWHPWQLFSQQRRLETHHVHHVMIGYTQVVHPRHGAAGDLTPAPHAEATQLCVREDLNPGFSGHLHH